MDENGIIGEALSHNQRMETKTQQKQAFTNANESLTKPVTEVLLSSSDAEEYKAYKRQKKVSEIMSAVAKSEANLLKGENVQRACERAVRLKQSAVKVFPSALSTAGLYLSGSHVRIDCVIGGIGETLSRVKRYEAKLALKKKANELTLVIAPSLIETLRYGEIKREIKRIAKISKKAQVKVWVDKKYPYSTLARLARICSDAGVKYFSIPYFDGCERLRFDLRGGCLLEVSEVETVAQFKKLLSFGIGRVVTDKIWDMYSEWMLEAEKITLANPKKEETPKKEELPSDKKEENKQEKPTEKKTEKQDKQDKPYNPETDYCCRLEGSELKFI